MAINVLEVLAIPSGLELQATAFVPLLNNPVLQPKKTCASGLSPTQACDASQAQSCKPYEAEGLFTLIFIDQVAGLQVGTPVAISAIMQGAFPPVSLPVSCSHPSHSYLIPAVCRCIALLQQTCCA